MLTCLNYFDTSHENVMFTEIMFNNISLILSDSLSMSKNFITRIFIFGNLSCNKSLLCMVKLQLRTTS